MRHSGGYLLMWRKILDSDFWQLSPVQRVVGLTCLFAANWQHGEWAGKTIRRGQWATSITHIAEACGRGVSKQQVRRSLRALEKIGFSDTATDTVANQRFTLVTICKYNDYQFPGNYADTASDMPTDAGLTPGRHRGDTRPTPIEVSKEEKTKDNTDLSAIASEFVALWNRYPKEPTLDRLTAKRRKEIAAKMKDKDFAEGWRDALVAFREAPWSANFRWFMSGDNWLSALEQRGRSTATQPIRPTTPPKPLSPALPIAELEKITGKKLPGSGRLP